jgi:hypothetical protein
MTVNPDTLSRIATAIGLPATATEDEIVEKANMERRIHEGWRSRVTIGHDYLDAVARCAGLSDASELPRSAVASVVAYVQTQCKNSTPAHPNIIGIKNAATRAALHLSTLDELREKLVDVHHTTRESARILPEQFDAIVAAVRRETKGPSDED